MLGIGKESVWMMNASYYFHVDFLASCRQYICQSTFMTKHTQVYISFPAHPHWGKMINWRTVSVKWLLISMVWTQVILQDWSFNITSSLLETLSCYMQDIYLERFPACWTLDRLEFFYLIQFRLGSHNL